VPRRRLAGFLLAFAVVLGACASQASPSIDPTQRPIHSDSPSPTPPATATQGVESGPPVDTPGATVYAVLAGDTLASIARRFGTSVTQLQSWNGARYPSLVSDPGTLLVGWRLVVADEPGVTPLPAPTVRPTTPPVAACHAGNRATAAFVRKELTDAAAILKAGTGQDPAPYWRPPYGTYNQAVLNAAASAGYTRTLLWDIDTIDWKPIAEGGPTAQQIANKVVGGAV